MGAAPIKERCDGAWAGCEHQVNELRALGLIETRGLVAAIEGADAATKAAEVRLLGRELVRDGIVTVKLTGQVADVRLAVEAGGAAASRVGTLLSAHVIPSLGVGMRELVDGGRLPFPEGLLSEGGAEEPRRAVEESGQGMPREGGVLQSAVSRRAVLEGMTLRQLRTLARAHGRLSGSVISRSGKGRLIELMLAAAEAADEDEG